MATLQSVIETEQSSGGPREIEAPAPTAWPLVLALGFTLMCAGLLTSASVSVLGAVLTVAGSAGWFGEVFPREHEIAVPVIPEDLSVVTRRRVVDRVPVAPDQLLASGAYAPHIGGRAGRIGRRRCDGCAGLPLRAA
jgi:hypothetical protein